MSRNSNNKALHLPTGKHAARSSRVEDCSAKSVWFALLLPKQSSQKKKKETVQALPQIMCTKWVSWDAVKTVQKNYERKYAPSLMCYYVKPGPAVWSSTFVAWFLQLPNNGGQNHVISCLNKYYWLCYKQKPFCLLQAVPCAVHLFSGK